MCILNGFLTPYQALGLPTGAHGAFRNYQIDAVSLEMMAGGDFGTVNEQIDLLTKFGRLAFSCSWLCSLLINSSCTWSFIKAHWKVNGFWWSAFIQSCFLLKLISFVFVWQADWRSDAICEQSSGEISSVLFPLPSLSSKQVHLSGCLHDTTWSSSSHSSSWSSCAVLTISENCCSLWFS